MEKYLKPQYAFVFFAITFGFLLIFLTPPFQSPDEPAHFAKAFSVSQGHFISQKKDNVSGDYLPSGLIEFENEFSNLFFDTSSRTSFAQIENSKRITLEKDKKTFINQKYHAMYSPLGYLPQGAGIFVFKLFSSSLYLLMIGSKTFLLLFYTVVGYFSIKSMPFSKWLTALVLLMPMSLSLGSSVSADGVLIALSVLFISKILQYTYQKEMLKFRQIALLSVFAILLALIKQSFLIALFVLFIPRDKFEKNYLKNLCLILLPAFLASVLWSKFSYSLFVPMNNANPELQIQFLLAHPIVYALTLLKTVYAYFLALIYSTVGILGWFDVFMFPIVYWCFIGTLFLNTFFQSNCDCTKFNSSNYQKALLLFLVLINFVVICTIIYVSWNVPQLISPFEGLQGRYFIPLVLPFFTFLFLLFNKKISNKFALVSLMNIGIIVVVYANIFFGLYIRYYANF